MIGRRGTIGFALLCALAFSAFAAPNAMALKGTTAFTCRPEPSATEKTEGFEDEHCTKPVKGTKVKWVHGEIGPGVQTQVIAGNTETEGKLAYPKFKSTIAGVEFELEAGGSITCIGQTSFENKENASKQMEISGSGCGKYYNVVVNKPKNCSVKNGEISINESGIGKSVVKETEGKSEMYGEFLPPGGKPFATFVFEGAECPLKGNTIEVTGSAKANITTEEGKLDGATLRFTTAGTEGTLKVGAIKAKFEATTTVRMLPTIGQEENPIVVTTTST